MSGWPGGKVARPIPGVPRNTPHVGSYHSAFCTLSAVISIGLFAVNPVSVTGADSTHARISAPVTGGILKGFGMASAGTGPGTVALTLLDTPPIVTVAVV